MLRHSIVTLVVVALPLAAQQKVPVAVGNAAYDSSLFRALPWRNIGPFRGGRANAIAGVPTQPSVYYVGYTGGGVWKTDDAGQTWQSMATAGLPSIPVTWIGFADASHGALLAATADASSPGLYLTSDSGSTWRPADLTATPVTRASPEPTAVPMGT